MYKGYSQEQNIEFLCRDKLSPVFKHGFLRSEENVDLAILYTPKSVSENIFLKNIFPFHNGRCYAICWADVIASIIMEDFVLYGQILLPTLYH